MKTILQSTPVNRPGRTSRLPFALTLASLALAIGCGDKPDSAPEAQPEPAAAKVSNEWTPVTVAETPTPGDAPAAKIRTQAMPVQPTSQEVVDADAKRGAEILTAAEAAGSSSLPPTPSPQAGPPPALQAIMKQGQAMNAEREALVTKLRATHEKAMKGETVLATKKLLDDAAIKEIAKIHPGIEPEWKRLQVLIKELENNQELAGNDPSKISEPTRAKFNELQTLSQKIEPLQMKVIDLPEIKKLRDNYANAVDAEVKRLDPQSEKLTARFEEISEKLNALQKQFMELQKKSMPAVPSLPTPQPK